MEGEKKEGPTRNHSNKLYIFCYQIIRRSNMFAKKNLGYRVHTKSGQSQKRFELIKKDDNDDEM